LPEPPGRYRILIVDYEPAVRLLLDRILVETGHDTTVALDAADALRLQAEAAPFDLLLTDVLMPDMAGVELVRRVRQTQPKLKARYVTGFAGPAVLGKARDGDEPFVEKPICLRACWKPSRWRSLDTPAVLNARRSARALTEGCGSVFAFSRL